MYYLIFIIEFKDTETHQHICLSNIKKNIEFILL